MEKLTITIDNMNNESFTGGKEIEVARILRDLANKIEQGNEPFSLRDYNGNKVGTIEIE